MGAVERMERKSAFTDCRNLRELGSNFSVDSWLWKWILARLRTRPQPAWWKPGTSALTSGEGHLFRGALGASSEIYTGVVFFCGEGRGWQVLIPFTDQRLSIKIAVLRAVARRLPDLRSRCLWTPSLQSGLSKPNSKGPAASAAALPWLGCHIITYHERLG